MSENPRRLMDEGASQNPGRNTIAGALTFPSRQDANLVPLSSQPRQPRNLQGLLRFAMEATKVEDAPGNSQLGPMDEERRKFLEQALRSLTVDVVEVLQKAIRVLSDPGKMRSIKVDDELPEDVNTAFDNIVEFVDDIDVANDFYKIGGFSIFPICFGCEHDIVRAKACSILAELCQNNPFCQARTLECGLLSVLLNLLETENGAALAKCIHAVSCACREYEPGCRELISCGGCDSLAKLLQHQNPHVRMRTAFFCIYLANQQPEARAKFIEKNVISMISEMLRQGRDSSSEHLLGLLLALVDALETSALARLQQDLGLMQLIEKYQKSPELLSDQCLEERDLCDEILKKLATATCQVSDEVER